MDIAASIQKVLEEIVLRMARHVHARTRMQNLCLAGGLPLVFVSTGPVEGQMFFLVGDAAGGEPAAEDYRDLVARLVEIEADVEKVDDLLVLKTDLRRARLLP
jgi:hypothetical protein